MKRPNRIGFGLFYLCKVTVGTVLVVPMIMELGDQENRPPGFYFAIL